MDEIKKSGVEKNRLEWAVRRCALLWSGAVEVGCTLSNAESTKHEVIPLSAITAHLRQSALVPCEKSCV